MNETRLSAMVVGGEGTFAEFKRELDFSSAKGKAELVKDLIALANSAIEQSYMILGVDNDKNIVGIDRVDEEAIQQIANVYISPSIFIECHVVPINQKIVGVIEIRPSRKPHKVGRGIEHIVLNRVYVRHGSVVTEASPDEIIQMHESNLGANESRKYVKAAEIHLRLGNLESAIKAYSAAIEFNPSAELYAARGAIYEKKYQTSDYLDNESRQLAFTDYSHAAELAIAPVYQTELRVSKWRVSFPVGGMANGDEIEEYLKEFEWVKANCRGYELGEVLYLDLLLSYYTAPQEGMNIVDRASKTIDLGYRTPEVYALRAEGHRHEFNYGLALKDIATAIELCTDHTSKKYSGYLSQKDNVIAHMKRTGNAYRG